MRNMSFRLTVPAVLDQSKRVTRRVGRFWRDALKPGDVFCACEKTQGIKAGQIARLAILRVTSVHLEHLNAIADPASLAYGGDGGRAEAALEGFPGMTGADFVAMFVRHMRCDPDTVVTRIAFTYTNHPVPGAAPLFDAVIRDG